MKKTLLLLLFISFLLNCKNNTSPDIKTVITDSEKVLNPNATYVKAEFTINGMTCAIGCAATIQKKLRKMDGIKFAVVDFDKSLAMVEYDKKSVTHNAIENTVTKISDIYTIKNMKIVDTFSVKKE